MRIRIVFLAAAALSAASLSARAGEVREVPPPVKLDYTPTWEIIQSASNKPEVTKAKTDADAAVEKLKADCEKDKEQQAAIGSGKVLVDAGKGGDQWMESYTEPQIVQQFLNDSRRFYADTSKEYASLDLPQLFPSEREFEKKTNRLWRLEREDFTVRQPFDVTIPDMVNGVRTYTVMPFCLRNGTSINKLQIPIRIFIFTDTGSFHPEVSSFTLAQTWEFSTNQPSGNPLQVWERVPGVRHTSEPPADVDLPRTPANVEQTWPETRDVMAARRHGTFREFSATDVPLVKKWETAGEMVVDILDNYRGNVAAATFQAGESRYGVAVFERIDLGAKDYKVVVLGLGNDYDYGKGVQRALVMQYARPGDEFHRNRSSIRLVKKEWQPFWNWNLTVKFDNPGSTVFTPVENLPPRSLFWFSFAVPNLTDTVQPFSLEQIARRVDIDAAKIPKDMLKMKVAVDQLARSGEGDASKIVSKSESREIDLIEGLPAERRKLLERIPMRIVDTGFSTVPKAAVMRGDDKANMKDAAGGFKPDRFDRDTRKSLAPGEEAKGYCIIDLEADIDWASFFDELERRLTTAWGAYNMRADNPEAKPAPEGDGKKLVKPVTVPRLTVLLTAEQRAAVRDLLKEQVKTALKRPVEPKAAVDKVVAADLLIKSGIASGRRLVIGSFWKPAEIKVDLPAGAKDYAVHPKDKWRLVPKE
jgi:hypothetical protein